MLTKVAWVKSKQNNFHACISWIYQKTHIMIHTHFPHLLFHHSKLSIQIYLILLINHNTTTSASTCASKQPKLKEDDSPSSWEQSPNFSWSLNLNPKPPQLRVWKVSSHHESAQPQLEFKLLSSYIPQCIGTFLHKILQKKLSHFMCFCSYQIYNSSCLPARFFSFSLVSAVIFDAESFAPAYCAWACLLLAS